MINCISLNKTNVLAGWTMFFILAFYAWQVQSAEPTSMGLEFVSPNNSAVSQSEAAHGDRKNDDHEQTETFSHNSDFFRMTGTRNSLFVQDMANEMQVRAKRNARSDVHIEIQTSPGRVVKAFIPSSGSIHIRFIQSGSGALIPLEDRDFDAFLWLYEQLEQIPPLKQFDVTQSLLDKVLRLLALLGPLGPGGHTLDIHTLGTPESYHSLCADIGQMVTATFDIDGQTYTVNDVVGPCSGGVCLGRCGPGCTTPPSPHVQRFAQECFNHDICCREGGINPCNRPWGNECGDEWLAAVDAFIRAPDCNQVNGVWQVEVDGESCFDGQCAPVNGVEDFNFSRRLSQSGAGISGVGQTRDDGRFPTYDLSFDNQSPPQITSGTIRYPTYMGSDCGNIACGWGSASVQSGTYACGELSLSYSGTWPWYYVSPDCTPAGNGSWDGTAEGLRQ